MYAIRSYYAILKKYGAQIPEGIVAFTPEEAVVAAKEIQQSTGSKFFVVKAQIHAGGRGKRNNFV